MAELTNKQLAFVNHYIASFFNATKAAELAGYAYPNVQGPRLLVNVSIADEISRRIDEQAMPANEVLARLSAQARGSIGAFIATDEDGKPNGFSLTNDRPLHLIKRVSVTEKGWSFEMYDAQAALGLLGKHHGLFVDRVELNDITDYSDVSPDEQITRLHAEIERLTTFAAWERTAARLTDAEPDVADDAAP